MPAPNPFDVLDVRPTASRMEVERAGQRLLAMLEVGAASVRHFRAGDEEHLRTPDLVRAALHTLRDPALRAQAELTASAVPLTLAAPPSLDLWDALALGTTRGP